MAGGWRKLHNEELHNLYFSPNIIRMIKDYEMGRTCSAHEENGMRTKFWLESLKGRDHSEDLGVDGMIRLKWI
jgi:hypothetical protein